MASEKLAVHNLRASRIVVRSDPGGIPGGQTRLLPIRKAEEYNDAWGDDVEISGMQRAVEPDWAGKTARELIADINEGKYDDSLAEIQRTEKRVTVIRAIESRLEK